MKIVVTQSDLNNKLLLLNKIVPSRPTHPILANILIEANKKNQAISLTAFDLNIGLSFIVSCEVIEDGKLTVPAKFFVDIVSKLDNNQVLSLNCDNKEDNYLLEITSGFGNYKVQGVDAQEYPEIPIVSQSDSSLSVPVELLFDGIKRTIVASSNDETKQILTGVHLKHDETRLEFAATDGHRLSVVEIDEEENEDKIKDFIFTVPSRALNELQKMLNGKGVVDIDHDESLIAFSFGNAKLTSRKLDGAYPNYKMLIPNSFETIITVDRIKLIKAIERVSVLADIKNNIVKLTSNSDSQVISVTIEAREVGTANEQIMSQISGDNITIGFNIKYLLDGLKSIDTNEVSFHLNTPKTPVIIKPLGGVNMVYLIMPVQIRY